MRRIVTALIMLQVMSSLYIWTPSLGASPENSARAAVLMEAETGRVLYEKNPHEKLPMASTTKIMTAILAIENTHPSDLVKISPQASGIEGSSLYLAAGEELTMEQLLYGLMLRSGNDAATAIAEHIAGSEEDFARMMNGKARDIGAMNTNFMNPHGLHHDQHYTTAYDLALISAYAMKNSTFREIVSTKYHRIPWQDQPWDRVLMNKNALLWDYEGANGIKTGYTKAARRCLASAALRDGMQLVAVVLNCQPWFEDSAAILDYGFREYQMTPLFSREERVGTIPVKNGFTKEVELVIKDDISLPLTEQEQQDLSITLNHPEYLRAPVAANTRVGTIDLTLGDNFTISKDIFTASDVRENSFPSNLRNIIRQWMDNSWDSLFPSP
jgi:D-alanyl-D-alanine carboxypeptidase (penicillin-binding protein 5/6)